VVWWWVGIESGGQCLTGPQDKQQRSIDQPIIPLLLRPLDTHTHARTALSTATSTRIAAVSCRRAKSVRWCVSGSRDRRPRPLPPPPPPLPSPSPGDGGGMDESAAEEEDAAIAL